MKSPRASSSSKATARKPKSQGKSSSKRTVGKRKVVGPKRRGHSPKPAAKTTRKTATSSRLKRAAATTGPGRNGEAAAAKTRLRRAVKSKPKKTKASTSPTKRRVSEARVSTPRSARKELTATGRLKENREQPAETLAPLAEVPPIVSSPALPDPLLVDARIRSQREAARAPLMPQGPKAPRPMPPRTGKPLWPRPHSS